MHRRNRNNEQDSEIAEIFFEMAAPIAAFIKKLVSIKSLKKYAVWMMAAMLLWQTYPSGEKSSFNFMDPIYGMILLTAIGAIFYAAKNFHWTNPLSGASERFSFLPLFGIGAVLCVLAHVFWRYVFVFAQEGFPVYPKEFSIIDMAELAFLIGALVVLRRDRKKKEAAVPGGSAKTGARPSVNYAEKYPGIFGYGASAYRHHPNIPLWSDPIVYFAVLYGYVIYGLIKENLLMFRWVELMPYTLPEGMIYLPLAGGLCALAIWLFGFLLALSHNALMHNLGCIIPIFAIPAGTFAGWFAPYLAPHSMRIPFFETIGIEGTILWEADPLVSYGMAGVLSGLLVFVALAVSASDVEHGVKDHIKVGSVILAGILFLPQLLVL